MKKKSGLLNTSKKNFLKDSQKPLGDIFDKITKLSPLPLSAFCPEKTTLIVVDMINGFVKEGALASPNVLAINQPIANLCKSCGEAGIRIAALCDSHPADSPEFESYPPHCVTGSAECEVTDEIKSAAKINMITKGSTNGMLEPAFKWWADLMGCDTFIIVGDCTDLCVLQLATSLKGWFNAKGAKSRVIVPAALVATYDLAEHTADLQSLFALYNMSVNGIELCKDISL